MLIIEEVEPVRPYLNVSIFVTLVDLDTHPLKKAQSRVIQALAPALVEDDGPNGEFFEALNSDIKI